MSLQCIVAYTVIVTYLSRSFAVSFVPTPLFAVSAVEDCVVQNIVRGEDLFGSLCGYFTDHHWPLEVYLDSRTFSIFSCNYLVTHCNLGVITCKLPLYDDTCIHSSGFVALHALYFPELCSLAKLGSQ